MLIEGEFNSDITQIQNYAFEVNGVSSIHFTLLEGAFEHFFILVKDPHKEIRALLTYKTRMKQYCLSKTPLTSDNNTVPGELPDGTWTVQIVRTYPIAGGFKLSVDTVLGEQEKPGRSVLMQRFDELKDPRSGWYQGDFHTHSAYSDGRVSLEEIADAAKEKKLDFIAMSDHSTVTTKFPEADVLVIPSTEITWDDNGHYNIHGIKELPDYASFLGNSTNKSDALNQMFLHYHKQGCMLSLNHPFPYGWELKHEYNLQNLDTLEVFNAPHLFEEEIDNERAVRFFDYLWNNGYYLQGIGGSDAHKKNYYGTYPLAIPMTRVYCEGLSIHNVVEAARKGNSYLQIEEDFEILFHRPHRTKELILPGNRTDGDVEMNARCKTSVIWQLIKNGEPYKEMEGRKFHQMIHIQENEYYRLQARSLDGNLILFVNPIHNMTKIGAETSFQRILQQFYLTERK